MMTLQSPEIDSRECKCVIRRVSEDDSTIEFAVRNAFCTGHVDAAQLTALGHGEELYVGREFTAEIELIEILGGLGSVRTVAHVVPGTVEAVIDGYATEELINQLRVHGNLHEVRLRIAQELSARPEQQIADALATLEPDDREAIDALMGHEPSHPGVVPIGTAISAAAHKSFLGRLSSIAGSLGL